MQVFESTRIKTGSRVEFQGHMLEVSLAPGICSMQLRRAAKRSRQNGRNLF